LAKNCRSQPFIGLGFCGPQRGTKAGADRLVKHGVFYKVLLVGELGKPEVEDVLGLYVA
jgi:hypothetical protein